MFNVSCQLASRRCSPWLRQDKSWSVIIQCARIHHSIHTSPIFQTSQTLCSINIIIKRKQIDRYYSCRMQCEYERDTTFSKIINILCVVFTPFIFQIFCVVVFFLVKPFHLFLHCDGLKDKCKQSKKSV